MEDFLSQKLLEFHPGASLPFHISPHFTFSTVSFSPPRRRSSPPISCRPNSHSIAPPPTPTEIVSTTECLDGSLLFRFGDPSEIVEIANVEEENEGGSISEAVGKEKITISSAKSGLISKEIGKDKITISSSESGSISKVVGKKKIIISSAKAGSIPKKINKEKIISSSSKSGSISKPVSKENISVSSAKSGSIPKEINKEKIITSSSKSGSFSKALSADKVEIGSSKHCSSDDATLEPNVVGIKTGNVVELAVLHTDVDDRELETGSVGVEEKKTSTSMPETRTDFHEESDIKSCSSNSAVLESNVVEMKTSNVVELTVSHTDAIEWEIEIGSVGVEEKETSTSMLESRTDFHEESDGSRIDNSITSPKYGTVVDAEISSLSDEEAPGEINDDYTLSPQVSLELYLSNGGCDSNEVTEIGENRLNVDSLDTLVHVGGSVTDDHEVELMPKYARLEADLALEEEIDDDLPGDLLAAESFVNSVVVDDGACHTVLADERTDSDIGSDEISDSGVGIEQTDTVAGGEEVSSPMLTLASGVASLQCPSQVLTGAEDAYFVADEKWFIVANSVGQWSLEGMKPGLYAHKLIQNFQSLAVDNDSCKANVREVLKQSAPTEQLPGLASVLIAHIDNEALHLANIGDTGFMIVRSGFVHKISTPVIHEFNLPVQIGSSEDPLEVAEEYQVHLDDGDVIIMATDGLFDNLYEKDIASIVSKSLQDEMKPKELAELLATRAQEVGRSTPARCPFADEAQAAGYTGYTGGKLDHVTVIVSLVKKQLSDQK